MITAESIHPSAAETEPPRSGLFLEENEARSAQERELRRMQTRVVPLLRLLGLNLIALLGVPLHNAFLLPDGAPAGAWLPFFLAVNAYCALSWLLLAALYRPRRFPDLALVFLATDMVFLGMAVLVTGGTASWMFWLPLVRVVDQAAVSARRTALFGMLAVATWLVAARLAGAGVSTPWAPELVKAALLAATAVYAVLTARAADRLRERSASALRVGRHVVAKLRVRSRELEEERQKAERENRARAASLEEVSRALVRATSAAAGSLPGPATLRALVAEIGELAERQMGLHVPAPGPLPIGDVIAAAVDAVEPVALESGVRLEWHVDDELPDVHADRRVLDRIVTNLLRHAVERSAPVGRVRLWCQARGGRVRVGVADSCALAAREEAEPLRDATACGRARAGLAFAASLAAASGATTGVETVPAGGTLYWVELPAAQPETG